MFTVLPKQTPQASVPAKIENMKQPTIELQNELSFKKMTAN